MSEHSYQYGYQNTPNGSGAPNGKKDGEWVSWAVIITLFAVGIWPVALIMLFLKLSDKSGKKTQKEQFPPLRTDAERKAQSACDTVERARSAAARAAEQAKAETRQTVEQVKAETRQTVEQVKAETRQAVEQAKAESRQAVEQTMEEARQAAEQARDGKNQKAAEPTSRARAAAAKMTRTPEMKSSTAKWMKAGGILVAAFGVMGVWNSVETLFLAEEWMQYYLWDFLRYAAASVAGAGLFIHGLRMDRQVKRFQKYLSIIGSFEAMSLEQLARKLGYSTSMVEKDLLKMIDKGLFGPSAYLNMELGYLFRNGEADAKVTQERERANTRQAPPPQETEEGYSGILRDIRRANDRIADPVLSSKIERLEAITARIFKAVEEDPKKRGRIDTFLNYYLPTTQKLLDSYAEFESTGVEGENLRQAKARIEATMDSIVAGFEHQLDELYQADFMDVDSDIRVMETMLGRDTGGAERDFGLGATPKPGTGGSAAAGKVTDLDFGGTAAQRQED